MRRPIVSWDTVSAPGTDVKGSDSKFACSLPNPPIMDVKDRGTARVGIRLGAGNQGLTEVPASFDGMLGFVRERHEPGPLYPLTDPHTFRG
jgi:hypothetical protein